MENTNLKNSKHIIKKIPIIIVIIFLIITTILFIYIIPNNTKINKSVDNNLFVQQNTNYIFFDNYRNMLQSNDLFYKRIYNYDDYIKEKELWTELIEMNPNDFKDYFFLIIFGSTYKTTGLYISNIYTENNKTCIELKRKDKWLIDDTCICAKISKELDRQDLEIINLPNLVTTNGKYIELDEITLNYSKEQAINDGCIVIENNKKIVSNNKNELDYFFENKKNGILRLYFYRTDDLSDYFCVKYIQYNNGIININWRTYNLKGNEISPTLSFTGDTLEKDSNNKTINYVCSNEMGDTELVCFIDDN